MKKKPLPAAVPVVSPEILDSAKRASSDTTDKLRHAAVTAAPAKCTVCGSACSAISTEKLCWVCRRLKISAWRDSDIQMNAQE